MNSPDISIIIVNYKTPELILRLLDSLALWVKVCSYEVIVVNNASKGADEQLICEAHPQTRWIETGYNAGFGRANNLGMRAAHGKTLLLLNSDTYAIDDSIDRCFHRLIHAADVIAAGAMQLMPSGEPRAFYHTFTFQRSFWILPPSLEKYLEKWIPPTRFDDPEQVDYIAAAFLMVKKGFFEQTGGFDEEFFLYGEDTEWGSRLGKLGKLMVYRDCFIVHEEWGSKPERYETANDFTHFNRFDPQIQLSNLVWIRKYYGLGRFFALMLHYWTWVPVFFLVRMLINVKERKWPWENQHNQLRFARTIGQFSKFFWRIVFRVPTFYRIES